MSRLRDIGESIGNAVLGGLGRAASRVQERKPLPVDLLESEDAYLAVFDAPGATAPDVSVRFEGNTLHVRIDRFRELYDGYEMRLPGRGMALSGSVTLPPEARVDPEGAEATVTTNGTLRVEIPRIETGTEEEGEDPEGDEDAPIEIDTGGDDDGHEDGVTAEGAEPESEHEDEHEHDHEDGDDATDAS